MKSSRAATYEHSSTPTHSETLAVPTRNESQTSPHRKVKVAYTMSRFPKLTETFILYEILALEKMGVEVELFPLLYEKQSVVHPEAQKMLPRAHFYPFLSPSVVFANLHFLWRKPGVYLRTWWEVLSGTFGSFNFFFGALGILPKSVKMAYEMQKRGVQHLHAHFCTHPAVAALIIKRLTGISYSFTAHGSDLHVERRMLDRKTAEAAFAVTISEFNKRVMIETCGPEAAEKIQVVHCGVDPGEFRPQPETAKPETLQLVCIASFEEVKGHRYLIEACKLLKDQGLDFRCHLVGYGPLKKQVQARVRELGLEERVVVHRPMSRPEVVRLLSESHIKVLPSVPTKRGKREGIPVVLMEAMACGLPVVSSRLSGIPELVEDGRSGLLVEPRDVPGLAQALSRLAHSPDLRRRMGEAGRKKVEAEFNLLENAERLTRLFLSHLSCRPS